MNQTLTVKTSLIVVALLAWSAAHAAPAAPMTKDDYKATKTRIEAEYKSDRAACASMSDNRKDVCIEEAKAKEKVARAELESSYSAKPSDQNKVLVVKAETAYAVAKEKCDDLSGNAKDVCVKEAKAIEVKALADAKMGKEMAEIRQDTSQEKRDADYKVALEKCDALTAMAKTTCISDAKTKFGKN